MHGGVDYTGVKERKCRAELKAEGWLRGTQSVVCRHVQFELKMQQIMGDIEH